MSDYLLPATSVDRPSFLAQLRPARFVSPAGVESEFLFDFVSRSFSKKASSHEISDSDKSVSQDQGTGTRAYPMNVYFAGEGYADAADTFVESLAERYTQDNPGTLHHPRWGDIPVMPFSVDQVEQLVGMGAGVSRVQVEFRQTDSVSFPTTNGLTEASVIADSDDLRDQASTTAEEIEVDSPSAYSRFRAAVSTGINAVTGALDGISDVIQDVQDEVDSIVNDINDGLDAFASPALIMGQMGSLVFGVADVVLSVPDRIDAYVDMTVGMVDSLVARYNGLVTADDKRRMGQTLQSMGALFAGATAVAALNTSYETRDAVGAAIDGVSEAFTTYRDGVDTMQVGSDLAISKQFVPDHNLLSNLYGIVAATQQLAINRAFDLKARKTIRLSAPSDALTLTWELYGDIEQLEFFCRTNRIVDGEYIEIPAGREIVVYV